MSGLRCWHLVRLKQHAAYHRSMLKSARSVPEAGSACLQYLGLPGISASCLEAIRGLLQLRRPIRQALILTCDDEHAFLFKLGEESDELLVVKAGFASGYAGEGPRTFAEALELLRAFEVDIDECNVSVKLMRRLEASALTVDDLVSIDKAGFVRPMRWLDYVYAWRERAQSKQAQLAAFSEVMPWALVDSRIFDLAWKFFDSEDDCISLGFRRLEDIVRERSGLHEHGVKLMQEAFMRENAPLAWNVVDSSEQKGRAQLFVGAFMAYRNPRAHRELGANGVRPLAEFLMLNHLYVLEGQATRTAHGHGPLKSTQT